MSQPLVSVITTTYNSANTLRETIDSVLAQTYKDWELVVVDDASTDNSKQIIETIAAKNDKIKAFYMTQNNFPMSSRAMALKNAKGRYAAFIDADDLWTPNKLEMQVPFMIEKKACLTYTGYRRISEDSKRVGTKINVPSSLTYDEYLKNTAIACSTVMIDRDQAGEISLPNVAHQDFATWLGILRKGHIAYGLSEDLMRYRIRKGSVSSNKLMNIQRVWHIYRNLEGLSVANSALCLAGYGTHAVLKRIKF